MFITGIVYPSGIRSWDLRNSIIYLNLRYQCLRPLSHHGWITRVRLRNYHLNLQQSGEKKNTKKKSIERKQIFTYDPTRNLWNKTCYKLATAINLKKWFKDYESLNKWTGYLTMNLTRLYTFSLCLWICQQSLLSWFPFLAYKVAKLGRDTKK